ncbi:LysR family transcriptional regulator [Archangium violaceum]|uniref:LysR family transcriptional regulator n=1 Tax=Archangium violaceum TaxID=83451 RepID=UPI00193C58CD|nr:LysR family transcriptional regulator [Archangium violaceum]QRK11396.1 LysR family transcriptional regulator [Archangium violaceum]
MGNKTSKTKPEVAISATTPDDLWDLRAFCLVVDHGSITAAAKQLGETKGSVSRRLSRLESALGVPLVRRSPRLVRPTEEGVLYRQRVGRALELIEDATDALKEAQGHPRGRLRVTAPPDFAHTVLAPVLARFCEAHRDISLELLLTDRELDFDANQLDIALRVASSLRDSSLVALRLLDAQMGFVASPAYLEREGRPRRLAELPAHRVLTMRRESGPSAVRLTPSVVVQDGAFLRSLALEGVGIAILPLALVEADLSQGRLVRLLSDQGSPIRISLYLLHPATPLLPARVRAFRDFMAHALQKQDRGPWGS